MICQIPNCSPRIRPVSRVYPQWDGVVVPGTCNVDFPIPFGYILGNSVISSMLADVEELSQEVIQGGGVISREGTKLPQNHSLFDGRYRGFYCGWLQQSCPFPVFHQAFTDVERPLRLARDRHYDNVLRHGVVAGRTDHDSRAFLCSGLVAEREGVEDDASAYRLSYTASSLLSQTLSKDVPDIS